MLNSKLLGEPAHARHIRTRIAKNKNCIIVVNGPTGSGKSYACLDLGLHLSKMFGTHFSIKDNVAFTFKDLIRNTQKEHNKQKGTCFIFEEVGVVGSGASAREWQSKANRFFSSFTQTARHKNQILIFNTPHFAFLEKGTRSLAHMQVSMVGINHKEKTSKAKVFLIQVNDKSGKLYFKFLRTRFTKNKETRTIRSRFAYFNMPPKEIINEYEKYKTQYTENLSKTILTDDVEKKVVGKRRAINPIILKDLKDLGYNNYEIARQFNVSEHLIRYNLKKATKNDKIQ